MNKLTNQLRESRQEDDFNEINLRQYQEELEQLTKELTKPSNVSIRENSTRLIGKISVEEVKTNEKTMKLFSENSLNFLSKCKYGM